MNIHEDEIDLDRAFPEQEDEDEVYRVRKSRKGIVALVLILLLAAAGLFVYFGCRVKTVHISGTALYTEAELKERMLMPEHCRNTLYAWFYYNHLYKKEIPFIETAEVKIESPTSLRVKVTEQTIRGYIPYADANLYFDENGVIIDSTSKVIDGVPLIQGFDFAVAEKGEKLPIEDLNTLQNLLEVTKYAKEYGIALTSVTFNQNGTITAVSGGIEVRLGLGTSLDRKMNLTAVLLKQLEGQSGILHMEDYDGTNGTRSFEEN